jgi:hypothetical protein
MQSKCIKIIYSNKCLFQEELEKIKRLSLLIAALFL